jgi:hypothetical protein
MIAEQEESFGLARRLLGPSRISASRPHLLDNQENSTAFSSYHLCNFQKDFLWTLVEKAVQLLVILFHSNQTQQSLLFLLREEKRWQEMLLNFAAHVVPLVQARGLDEKNTDMCLGVAVVAKFRRQRIVLEIQLWISFESNQPQTTKTNHSHLTQRVQAQQSSNRQRFDQIVLF